MGKSQFDEPMTFAKWWAIRSSALLELKLTPAQWYEKFAGTNIDTGGTPQLMLNTSGEITEANSAGIESQVTVSNGHLTILRARQYQQGPPLFQAVPPFTDATAQKAARKLFQTAVTATAGGEIVAVNVGPASVAGYQACMIITHVWSDSTQANITTTWAASAGALDTGLATIDISTTADTVTPDWGNGLAWQTGNDAATIQVAAAAGQCAANQNIVFCGTYWYET